MGTPFTVENSNSWVSRVVDHWNVIITGIPLHVPQLFLIPVRNPASLLAQAASGSNRSCGTSHRHCAIGPDSNVGQRWYRSLEYRCER